MSAIAYSRRVAAGPDTLYRSYPEFLAASVDCCSRLAELDEKAIEVLESQLDDMTELLGGRVGWTLRTDTGTHARALTYRPAGAGVTLLDAAQVLADGPRALSARIYELAAAHPVRGAQRAKPQASSATASGMVQMRRGVGRNEPCPCGSGVKYKRCCGRYTSRA